MVQWLARLPGTQEIRGSSPGRGMTDFVRQYSFVYINACIVQLFKSSIYIYIYIYIYKGRYGDPVRDTIMIGIFIKGDLIINSAKL